MIINQHKPIIPKETVSLLGGNKQSYSNIMERESKDQVSFTGVEALAKKVPEGLLKSKVFHKVLELAEHNPSFFEVAFATSIMLTLRPLSILAVPGAKKDDKQYAAVKGICSALTAFTMTALLYIPMARYLKGLGNSAKFMRDSKRALAVGAKYLEKTGSKHAASRGLKLVQASLGKLVELKGASSEIGQKAMQALTLKSSKQMLEAAKGLTELASKSTLFPFPTGKKSFDLFNYIINYGSKFIIAPLEAMVLFKLIPPVMNKMFPDRKKKGKFDPPPRPFAAKLNQDQQRLLDQFMTKAGKGVK